MRILVIVVVAALLLSKQIFAAVGDPKTCSAPLLVTYTQKALDQALLKTGQPRRDLLIHTLLKVRDLCAVDDDGAELAEYFSEKVHSSVEISLDIENRFPTMNGGFVATAVADVKKLAKNYILSSKPSVRCRDKVDTTAGITALYEDRFNEKFIGFLQEKATVQVLHPHLIRSNLSGSLLKVKVISNSDDDGDHYYEGKTGYISSSDTDWNEDCL